MLFASLELGLVPGLPHSMRLRARIPTFEGWSEVKPIFSASWTPLDMLASTFPICPFSLGKALGWLSSLFVVCRCAIRLLARELSQPIDQESAC